jgi:hypothetical protein
MDGHVKKQQEVSHLQPKERDLRELNLASLDLGLEDSI